MKLERKIFISFLALLASFDIIICSFCYLSFKNKYTSIFNEFYSSVNKSISDTLTQLDHETNKSIFTTRELIQQNEPYFEKLTNEELKLLSKRWGVSHLYTINSKNGKYITSSCEPPNELPSIFKYCDRYRLFFEGKLQQELTPLVFGNPELEAYKFFHFPSKNRKKVFEVAIHAGFIGRTLRKTVESVLW